MTIDAIIDFETLGQTDDAVLLSVGVLIIDPEILDPENPQKTFDDLVESGLYVKIDATNQVKKYNRRVSKETVDWWSKQGPEAKAVLARSVDDVDLINVAGLIESYLKANNFNGHLWSRGMIDGRWLQSMCSCTNTDVPSAPWWTHRDVRTCIDVLCGTTRGYLPKSHSFGPNGFIAHNPVHDCARDVIQMMIAYGYEG